MPPNEKKNPIAAREEETLKFWKENKIFEKSLAKPSPKGEFVFYEGPPTANGRPGIHHFEARAFKDAIPRYKTMRGFHVRRKGGWDTHGLPVELAVEKELGLKSKKEIESYGIAAFNQKCRESVWKYADLWRQFTNRMGFWVNLNSPYVTYSANYIESLWAIFKQVNERGLLYKDYKVVPWCPRCGTALSSHELAQGYEDVKDLSITVKLKLKSKILNLKSDEPLFILAWTTTPWTLPGNVGLAVNSKITYSLIESEHIRYIVGRERVSAVFKDRPHQILEEFKGEKLVGLEYEPLYPFLKDNLPAGEKDKLKNACKVYAADFVTTTDGTGIVHTAVMYGQDDFELGTKVGLPKFHLVSEDGTFKKETGFLAGKFVKDEATDVEIIKDLAHRGLLFAKEKYAHSYPFCWRCHTPLIYYARDSWYIAMSKLRKELAKENEKINWEPAHIKEGRFGEWLKEAKDWAISRERYWGTPLPVWQCGKCEKREVLGSFDEVRKRASGTLTKIILVRHGWSEKNVKDVFSSVYEGYPLTKEGIAEAREGAKLLKKEKIDAIYSSPVHRAVQTAEIVGKGHGKIIVDERIREVMSGLWDERGFHEPQVLAERKAFKQLSPEDFYNTPRGSTGESWRATEERMVGFLKDILVRHKGQTVLLVSHEGPLSFLMRYLQDIRVEEMKTIFKKELLGGFGLPKAVYVDNSTGKEFNPHRPRIDDIVFACKCGGEMKRVKEVVDVWFDSGAMPFAEDHYPFENTKWVDGAGYPADYISEAVDQTRGWFYTLHAIGVLTGKGRAYKNVVCLGHILDAEGKKMSKSVGNVVDPWIMMDKYGADALRLWMYSVNQPGESKNFDEKTVDEIVKKVFNLASNVLAFYKLYESENSKSQILNPKQTPNSKSQIPKSENVLDRWILARLNQLTGEVTKNLDEYRLFEPVRAIRDFIGDLSQWYLRRSRTRFKSEIPNPKSQTNHKSQNSKEESGEISDKENALATLHFVLLELSKLLAPFAPFFAEHLYQQVKSQNSKVKNESQNEKVIDSVHLESWPQAGKVDEKLLKDMEEVRKIVSLALEARAKANIKVRQPLASIKIRSTKSEIRNEMLELVKDEVNVKEILFDKNLQTDVAFDTAITPELKEEGDFRELVRAVQDLRKESGLNPGDLAALVVSTDAAGEAFVKKYEAELSKAAQLKKISFTSLSSGTALALDNFSFTLSLQR